MRIYGPLCHLFQGSSKWVYQCGNQDCKHIQTITRGYECIRLERQGLKGETSDLRTLLKSTYFDLASPEHGTPTCQICRNYSLSLLEDRCSTNLPNLLLIDFGDTNQGFRVRLPIEFSLDGPQSYCYVGSIGLVNLCYVTHVAAEQSGRFLLHRGAICQESSATGMPESAKVALYRLQPLPKHRSIASNIQCAIEAAEKCTVALPDFWKEYLTELRNIPPLISPFVCLHGFVCPQTRTKCSQSACVPPQIYAYLVDIFGGVQVKVTQDHILCEVCQERVRDIDRLKESEREIAKFADRLSNRKARVYINRKWLERWQQYLYSKETDPYLLEGLRRPGPINNAIGLDPETGSVDQTRYRKISPEVWYFFKRFYGGGPYIATAKTDPSLALTQAVELRYQAVRTMLVRLGYGK